MILRVQLSLLLVVLAAAATAEEKPVRHADHHDLAYYLDEAAQKHPVKSTADWEIRKQHILAAMQQVMGELPERAKRVPLDVNQLEEVRVGKLIRRKISYQSELHDRVAAYLFLPQANAEKLPAVLCLHQTTSLGSAEPAGLGGDPDLHYALHLAERGYVTLAPDYPSFGEHAYDFDPKHGYQSGTMKAIWDNLRAVDLLESLPQVDADRIGCIGHSLGGHNTMFTAAFEPRIKVLVSSCGFTRLDKDDLPSWTGIRYMPRIASVFGNDPRRMPFDFTEIVGAFAPRPFLACAAERDSDFDVSGVRDVIAAAKPIYKLYGHEENLQAYYPNTAHAFPADARRVAYEFFDQHLKPLVGHWKLAGDTRDDSPHANHGSNRGVEFGEAKDAARFDGRDDYIEVPDSDALRLGTDPFSISVHVHTDAELDDVLGDILSKYDPAGRTGFQLGIQNHAGVTSSQANYRHLHFGIDHGRIEPAWTDHGRLGSAVLIYSMAVYRGQLFAGTCVAGPDQAGGVFRYDGDHWTDCGPPDRCNSVSSMAVHDGRLYVGVSKYRLAGSALDESPNPHLGGKVYRYEGDGNWVHCGTLPGVEAINGMVVYRGKLYASSMYRPAGFFRYEGGTQWTSCGVPDGKRVESLAVYNGSLFATSYDGGGVYRYDGSQWTDTGRPGDATQTYGFAVHEGRLHVSEWPHARVYRYDGDGRWIDAGRLGQEQETMPLVVYNGKMYGGTLPSAAVFRYDGGTDWTKVGRLDFTPDVKYRRAWSMAVYRGRLFAGTLPSGHVWSIEAGKNATCDTALEPGWRHIAAVKTPDELKLYVDGRLVAASTSFDAADYDLTNDAPLKIGLGAQDYFNGRMRDLRIYRRALSEAEIDRLAR